MSVACTTEAFLPAPHPMIPVRCTCGELFHADEQHVGRRLRCRCGSLVEIRAPEPAERPAASPLRAHRPPDARPPRAAWTPSRLAGWRPGRALERVLDFASLGYLGATLVACAMLWGLSDQWWPATLLLFFGRWVLLLPLVMLLPAALLARRRLVLPLVAALLVVLFPVMGLRTGLRLPARGVADAPRLRVVSFNTAALPNLGGYLDELLREWQADLVAFQECGDQLAAAVTEAQGWHGHAHGGLCLVSRYPIRSVAGMDRSALARIRETTEIGGSGHVLRYSIETPYGPVDLVNLHLETPRKGFDALAAGDLAGLRANTTLRGVESRLARQFASQATAPTLIAGDFNMPVESRIYQTSWGGLGNAFSVAGRGFGSTRQNGWIRVRIDHVLTGPEWWTESARVWRDEGSDHRPLVADLRLRR
jgi:vancomycin resistance protein VanJ